jgi:hypothetical protein
VACQAAGTASGCGGLVVAEFVRVEQAAGEAVADESTLADLGQVDRGGGVLGAAEACWCLAVERLVGAVVVVVQLYRFS